MKEKKTFLVEIQQVLDIKVQDARTETAANFCN